MRLALWNHRNAASFFVFLLILFSAANVYADSFQQLYRQGVALVREGKSEEAIIVFEKALALRSDYAPLHNVLGVLYGQREGGFADAIASFERSVALEPTNAEAHFNAALLYASEKDFILAEEYLRKTIALNPSFAKAYMNLGWVELIEKENAGDATALFQKAIDLEPNLANAHYGLGMAHASLGKNELVLKPISMLRAFGENEMAKRLEDMLHEDQEASSFTEDGDKKLTGDAAPKPVSG